ncbi:hypothetical protein glysoja_023178, partial [Glycine soja]
NFQRPKNARFGPSGAFLAVPWHERGFYRLHVPSLVRHHPAPPATPHRQPVKPVADKGLSALELEKLPRVTGKELVLGNECAVCLDEIESEQPARLVPGCNHGFHVHCADTWLSKHPLCPVCRTKLDPQIFTSQSPC